MLKALAKMLARPPADTPPEKNPPPQTEPVEEVESETAPIYQSLAMTDELREALFPRAPQMVSALFDRPLQRPAEPLRTPEERTFPIV